MESLDADEQEQEVKAPKGPSRSVSVSLPFLNVLRFQLTSLYRPEYSNGFHGVRAT